MANLMDFCRSWAPRLLSVPRIVVAGGGPWSLDRVRHAN